MIIQANGIQTKARLAMIVSEKLDLKIKTIIRDKEGHYQMIKLQSKKKTKTILNIYVANIGAPQYLR